MSKHTPKSWYFDGLVIRKDIKDRAHVIARLEDWGDETESNGRLIAAAPDLLEALAAFAYATRNNTHLARQYKAAMAAIAKAEGKS